MLGSSYPGSGFKKHCRSTGTQSFSTAIDPDPQSDLCLQKHILEKVQSHLEVLKNQRLSLCGQSPQSLSHRRGGGGGGGG